MHRCLPQPDATTDNGKPALMLSGFSRLPKQMYDLRDNVIPATTWFFSQTECGAHLTHTHTRRENWLTDRENNGSVTLNDERSDMLIGTNRLSL